MRNPFLLLEIKNKKGELHFRRYGIKTPWFGIFLHFIYKADEEKHLHDHPWNYVSLCLYGHFTEEYNNPKFNVQPCVPVIYQDCRAGKIIIREAKRFHKIHKLYSKVVCTLFLTGSEKRNWGYWLDDNTWVDHETYRKMKREGKFN